MYRQYQERRKQESQLIIQQSKMGAQQSKKGEKGRKHKSGHKDVVEQKVCQIEEMQNGEMRMVDVAEAKVLLVKDKDEFFAVGGKCSHYSAPLNKGVYNNGLVRCPWHGACFSVKTGDIEDFPGLDSLPKFEVDVSNGQDVIIRATKDQLANTRRVKDMCKQNRSDEKTFLIIGGGAAAATCVETLRQEGFTGKIVMATKDKYPPYDRPKLSKNFAATGDSISLRKPEAYKEYNIDLQTEKEAVSLDNSEKTVTFKDGSKVKFDKVLLATGGSPRTLDVPGKELSGIFVMRDVDNANALGQAAAGKKAVVIGTSFIGLESAVVLAGMSSSVTVVGRSEPLAATMGAKVGAAMKKVVLDKGVEFCLGRNPTAFEGADGKLTAVILDDGTKLEADVCLLGIGVRPATDFVKESGLEMIDSGYINVNKCMETSQADVYAAGDIVQFPLFLAQDKLTNIQHWQMAKMQGRIAGLNMVGKKTDIKSCPFFWTMMAGKSMRFAGYNAGYQEVIIHGEVEEFKFVAYYIKDDKVVGIASMGSDPIAAQFAELLYSDKSINKSEIDAEASWTAKIAS